MAKIKGEQEGKETKQAAEKMGCMAEVDLTGLGVALITPFKEDGSIDFDALPRLVDYQLENGTDYIVALGTTAETPTLFRQEKNEVVRCIVERVNGRVPVVMGVGGNNTAALWMSCKPPISPA